MSDMIIYIRGLNHTCRLQAGIWRIALLPDGRQGFHGIRISIYLYMLLFEEITERILGAAFDVHTELGNGFQEVIYQRALAFEFYNRGLAYDREIEQQIYYKDLVEPIGTRRADFVVEDKVLVEIKAVIRLEDVHLAQALNYLKAYKLKVGLLINFGSKSLTFKRLVY